MAMVPPALIALALASANGDAVPMARAAQAAPPPAAQPLAPSAMPSAANGTVEQATDETLVAFTTVDDRMTVPVRIADSGPYRFVVDTGSERTVISRQLANTLRLNAGPQVNVMAMTGTTLVGTVQVPSLTVSDIPGIGQIDAPALDARHLGGEGLLGIDTLRDHKVVIDLNRQNMTVSPSKKLRRSRPAGRDEIVVVAKSRFGQLIVTDTDYGGTPIRIIIDTGTSVTVGNMALKQLLLRRRQQMATTELLSVTGGIIKADYGAVPLLRIGTLEIANLGIAFFDAAPFDRFGLRDKPAMLLGMNALASFRRVQIDFANREIRFLMPESDGIAVCARHEMSGCPA